MGKKSKNPRKERINNFPPATSQDIPPAAVVAAAAEAPTHYPSDGPSNEEWEDWCLQTTSESLQAKLDQLTSLALANDRANFVRQFVPLDLSDADAAGYLQDLTTAPEADGQWTNLASEIAALAAGRGVTNIEGDQQTRTVFYFEHPLLPGCDREVTFVRGSPEGEWRAEG
uniref:Uncharacterized protein n=1 Tax=Amphora coffeiformis TaxID=265554 RepID=A0A7S3P2B5_9STRA